MSHPGSEPAFPDSCMQLLAEAVTPPGQHLLCTAHTQTFITSLLHWGNDFLAAGTPPGISLHFMPATRCCCRGSPKALQGTFLAPSTEIFNGFSENPPWLPSAQPNPSPGISKILPPVFLLLPHFEPNAPKGDHFLTFSDFPHAFLCPPIFTKRNIPKTNSIPFPL